MSQIRKGQVITTFGPGAIYIDSFGVSLLISGIDHWFTEEGELSDKYQVYDERLAKRLNVNHFRLAPDYQKKEKMRDGEKFKSKITPLAAYRFPTWHVCSKCRRLQQLSPIVRKTPLCEVDRCKGKIYQVRFVAACSNGHLQEFPWREWVHAEINASCKDHMILSGSGGALGNIWVNCGCGKSRSLAGITRFEEDYNDDHYSVLSNELEKGILFRCSSRMPWLGTAYKELENHECEKPLVGMLRQATNLYFPKLVSSLKIPIEADENLSDVVDIITNVLDSDQIDSMKTFPKNTLIKTLRQLTTTKLEDIPNETIYQAVQTIFNGSNNTSVTVASDNEEEAHRRQERRFLIQDSNKEALKCNVLDISSFSQSDFNQLFSIITKVERLTETRALAGIDRIHTGRRNNDEYYGTICRNKNSPDERWLPAMRMYGEGIYLELDSEKLSDWECKNADWLETRISGLKAKASNSMLSTIADQITARYLLVHSFAHILINALVFECGYSSAALRERLYVSSSKEAPMAGVLIYTAAGDTEGSLGGLMAMSDQNRLIPIVLKALAEARWCSSDPICTESGERGGQGPSSMNLAACHSCMLLPETSCEHMNMLLDRRLLVSEHNDGKGFFDKM